MKTVVTNAFVISNATNVIKIQESGYYVMSVTYTPTGSYPEFGISDGEYTTDLFLTDIQTVHLNRAVLGYFQSGKSIDFSASDCVVRIMIEKVE